MSRKNISKLMLGAMFTVLLALVMATTALGQTNARALNTPPTPPPTNKVCNPIPTVTFDAAAQQAMTKHKIRIVGHVIYFDAHLVPVVDKEGYPTGTYRPYQVGLIPTKPGDRFNRALQIIKLDETDLLFVLEECGKTYEHYLVSDGLWQGDAMVIKKVGN